MSAWNNLTSRRLSEDEEKKRVVDIEKLSHPARNLDHLEHVVLSLTMLADKLSMPCCDLSMLSYTRTLIQSTKLSSFMHGLCIVHSMLYIITSSPLESR